MNSKIEAQVKGWLKVFTIDSKGNQRVLYNDHNAINNNPGCQIAAHALAGDPGWSLDKIGAYLATSLVAYTPITNKTYPSGNQLKLLAVFSEASFNSLIDELSLEAGGNGKFATVSGLNITKDNTLKLGVEWTITITKLV